MRICSLLPSATEIVAELGLVESLVGISEECDWPPEVRGLPVVTASRVETTRLTSLEIERAVREAVGDGRPLYAIDRALLETLQPDLILAQNLCADQVGLECLEQRAVDRVQGASVTDRLAYGSLDFQAGQARRFDTRGGNDREAANLGWPVALLRNADE